MPIAITQGFMNGQRAIQIEVQRAATADTLATNRILQNYLKEIEGTLPAGLEIKQYDIRANALTERIMLLVTNGLGGLMLVVGILFIFLNARIAFWVGCRHSCRDARHHRHDVGDGTNDQHAVAVRADHDAWRHR